jgi:hypothetical protein
VDEESAWWGPLAAVAVFFVALLVVTGVAG